MKTAVGIFSNSDRAAEAMRALIQSGVPVERITLLTRSESDRDRMARHLRAEPGLQSGEPSARLSVLSIPGMSPVLVEGPDVRDLFDPPAVRLPDSPGEDSDAALQRTPPSPAEPDDWAYFRHVLDAGSSVIVVRSDSLRVAASACEILNRLSLGIGKAPSLKSQVSVRQVPGAAIVTLAGKLALDDGCALLRETVRALLDGGQVRILLNLERISHLDSAGLGELVRSHVAVRNRRGQLTLVNPSANVRQLLHLTRMDQVFAFAPDALTALAEGQVSPR